MKFAPSHYQVLQEFGISPLDGTETGVLGLEKNPTMIGVSDEMAAEVIKGMRSARENPTVPAEQAIENRGRKILARLNESAENQT